MYFWCICGEECDLRVLLFRHLLYHPCFLIFEMHCSRLNSYFSSPWLPGWSQVRLLAIPNPFMFPVPCLSPDWVGFSIFSMLVGLVVGLLNLCCLPKLVQTYITQNEDLSHNISISLIKMKWPFLGRLKYVKFVLN